jgi:hypothetical protein
MAESRIGAVNDGVAAAIVVFITQAKAVIINVA